jgi:hypothetical protein
MHAPAAGHTGMDSKARAHVPTERDGPRSRRRDSRHLRHSGPYLDVDADVDIAYGDGTPESLVDAQAEAEHDSWRPDCSPWAGVWASWAPGSAPQPSQSGADYSDAALDSDDHTGERP